MSLEASNRPSNMLWSITKDWVYFKCWIVSMKLLYYLIVWVLALVSWSSSDSATRSQQKRESELGSEYVLMHASLIFCQYVDSIFMWCFKKIFLYSLLYGWFGRYSFIVVRAFDSQLHDREFYSQSLLSLHCCMRCLKLWFYAQRVNNFLKTVA